MPWIFQQTLCKQGGLASLVLCDLVHSVLAALLASTESLPRLGNIHHLANRLDISGRSKRGRERRAEREREREREREITVGQDGV